MIHAKKSATVLVIAMAAALVTTGNAATQGRNSNASVHLRPLTTASPTGTDSVRVDVYGTSLVDVKQVELTLRLQPANAFDYARSSFSPYP